MTRCKALGCWGRPWEQTQRPARRAVCMDLGLASAFRLLCSRWHPGRAASGLDSGRHELNSTLSLHGIRVLGGGVLGSFHRATFKILGNFVASLTLGQTDGSGYSKLRLPSHEGYPGRR